MTDLLPIGSIVKTDEDKPICIMIAGYYPIDANDSKCYQYAGVPYPNGLPENNCIMLFNQKDIKKVIFEGYVTSESREMIRRISSSID